MFGKFKSLASFLFAHQSNIWSTIKNKILVLSDFLKSLFYYIYNITQKHDFCCLRHYNLNNKSSRKKNKLWQKGLEHVLKYGFKSAISFKIYILLWIFVIMTKIEMPKI